MLTGENACPHPARLRAAVPSHTARLPARSVFPYSAGDHRRAAVTTFFASPSAHRWSAGQTLAAHPSPLHQAGLLVPCGIFGPAASEPRENSELHSKRRKLKCPCYPISTRPLASFATALETPVLGKCAPDPAVMCGERQISRNARTALQKLLPALGALQVRP